MSNYPWLILHFTYSSFMAAFNASCQINKSKGRKWREMELPKKGGNLRHSLHYVPYVCVCLWCLFVLRPACSLQKHLSLSLSRSCFFLHLTCFCCLEIRFYSNMKGVRKDRWHWIRFWVCDFKLSLFRFVPATLIPEFLAIEDSYFGFCSLRLLIWVLWTLQDQLHLWVWQVIYFLLWFHGWAWCTTICTKRWW